MFNTFYLGTTKRGTHDDFPIWPGRSSRSPGSAFNRGSVFVCGYRLLSGYSRNIQKLCREFQEKAMIFGVFGNCRGRLLQVVSSVGEGLITVKIQPDAAKQIGEIGDSIGPALEHLDLVIQSFNPAAR